MKNSTLISVLSCLLRAVIVHFEMISLKNIYNLQIKPLLVYYIRKNLILRAVTQKGLIHNFFLSIFKVCTYTQPFIKP